MWSMIVSKYVLQCALALKDQDDAYDLMGRAVGKYSLSSSLCLRLKKKNTQES